MTRDEARSIQNPLQKWIDILENVEKEEEAIIRLLVPIHRKRADALIAIAASHNKRVCEVPFEGERTGRLIANWVKENLEADGFAVKEYRFKSQSGVPGTMLTVNWEI